MLVTAVSHSKSVYYRGYAGLLLGDKNHRHLSAQRGLKIGGALASFQGFECQSAATGCQWQLPRRKQRGIGKLQRLDCTSELWPFKWVKHGIATTYYKLQSYLKYIKPIREFSDQTRKRVKHTTGGSGLMGTGKSSTPDHTIPPCMLMPCLGFIGIWDFLRANSQEKNVSLFEPIPRLLV